MARFLDHHLIAEVSLAGMALDLLGGLYLAYDLLGGKTGPLRTLMRVASYSVVYFSVYSLLVGPVLGLIFGIGLGVILGVEFSSLGSAAKSSAPTRFELALLVCRGIVFAVATSQLFGFRYGATFGGTGFLILLGFYYLGYTPRQTYDIHERPRLTKVKLVGAFVRMVTVLLAGLVASLTTDNPSAVQAGIELGLLVGIGNGCVVLISPYIEWFTNEMPERRFGLLGVLLIFCGAVLQSVQYWVAVVDIPVR